MLLLKQFSSLILSSSLSTRLYSFAATCGLEPIFAYIASISFLNAFAESALFNFNVGVSNSFSTVNGSAAKRSALIFSKPCNFLWLAIRSRSFCRALMICASLKVDSKSAGEMGRPRTLEAHIAYGSGSIPMMATREVCVLSP